MAKLKVILNKPEPSKEVVNKYKKRFESKLIKKSRTWYRFQGMRYLLYKDRLYLYFMVVILMVLAYLLFDE